MSPCVSVFDLLLWDRRQKRTWGHHHIECYYCDLLDLQTLQSFARSPQERCCLTKLFAWPFYFTSRFVASLQNSTVSKEKNGLEIVICLEKRERKKSETWGKICGFDTHSAWNKVLCSSATRLPNVLHGQMELGNELLSFQHNYHFCIETHNLWTWKPISWKLGTCQPCWSFWGKEREGTCPGR